MTQNDLIEISKMLESMPIFYRPVSVFQKSKQQYWNLIGTDFFIVILYSGYISWRKYDKSRHGPQMIPWTPETEINFEYILNNISEEIGIELLFNLDIFNNLDGNI